MAQDRIAPTGTAQDGQVGAQTAADAALSRELVAEIDPWIDLQKPGTEADVLMRHLTQRYAEATGAFLPGAAADPARLQALLRMLVQQLARAQADLFVLKSAVLGRDQMVLTRDWEYRDPLEVHRAALGRDAAAAAVRGMGRYTVPLDEDLLGFGWYATETKNASSWRWSGPGLQSTLLLPRFFEGRARIEIMFNTLRRDVLPATGAVTAGGRPVAYVLHYPDATTTAGVMVFEVDLAAPAPGEAPPAYLPLQFTLAATCSPHVETGSNDKRDLGICVRRIVISVAS